MKTLIIAGLSVASLSIMSLYAWRYKNKAFKRKKTHRVEISIHNSVIGCVIGKGGDNLKRIESKSGAKIKFYSGGFSSEYSLFVVKGDQNQVSFAEIMIAQVLKETLNELNASSLSQSSDYEFLSQFSKNLDDRLDKSIVADDSKADFNVSDLKEELINFAVGHTQKLYSVSDDGFIPVYVSAVATPHIFWVQAIRTKEHIELDRLTEELAEYYKTHPELDVPLNYSSVKVGLICATYFEQDKRWYRAEISEVLSVNEQDVNETTIDLYFLDYGESSYQKIKNIRAIPSEFLELKFQAIECSLSNIKPIGETWTEESVSFFEEITHVGQWYTMLARIDDENDGHRPGLTLIDTTSEKDVNIAEEMVSKGFAEYSI